MRSRQKATRATRYSCAWRAGWAGAAIVLAAPGREASVVLFGLAGDALAGMGQGLEPLPRNCLAARLAETVGALVEGGRRVGDGAGHQLRVVDQSRVALGLEGLGGRLTNTIAVAGNLVLAVVAGVLSTLFELAKLAVKAHQLRLQLLACTHQIHSRFSHVNLSVGAQHPRSR